MNLNALKIDPEFQGKIPPLTFEELNQLEANILRDGRIINPIIVWQGLIVDGHNRFTIAKKHPEIPFTVHEKEFASRYEAIIWICKNQLSGAANSMMRRWESVFREYPDILSDAENRASVGRTIQKLRDYLKNLEDKMEELL